MYEAQAGTLLQEPCTLSATPAAQATLTHRAWPQATYLSGHARSARGPMVEIHDASSPTGAAALFGFVGVPARLRQGLPEETLRAQCLGQLIRLFGREAANPIADGIKDWALDPQTATQDDLEGDGQHPIAPIAAPTHGLWQGRITGIGSEWSPQFSGYLAGCVEATDRGIRALVATGPIAQRGC